MSDSDNRLKYETLGFKFKNIKTLEDIVDKGIEHKELASNILFPNNLFSLCRI